MVWFGLLWVGFCLGWVRLGLGLVPFGFALGWIRFGLGLLWVGFGLVSAPFGFQSDNCYTFDLPRHGACKSLQYDTI